MMSDCEVRNLSEIFGHPLKKCFLEHFADQVCDGVWSIVFKDAGGVFIKDWSQAGNFNVRKKYA